MKRCYSIIILLLFTSGLIISQENIYFIDFGFSNDASKLSTAIGLIKNIERNKPEKAEYFIASESNISLDSLVSYSNHLKTVYTNQENSYPPSFIRDQTNDLLTYERFYYKYDKEKDQIKYLVQIVVTINEEINSGKVMDVIYLRQGEVFERDREIKALWNKKHIGLVIHSPNIDLMKRKK